jgi:hypothetical protein
MCRDDRGFGDDAATAELVVIHPVVECSINVRNSAAMNCTLNYAGNLKLDVLTADSREVEGDASSTAKYGIVAKRSASSTGSSTRIGLRKPADVECSLSTKVDANRSANAIDNGSSMTAELTCKTGGQVFSFQLEVHVTATTSMASSPPMTTALPVTASEEYRAVDADNVTPTTSQRRV